MQLVRALSRLLGVLGELGVRSELTNDRLAPLEVNVTVIDEVKQRLVAKYFQLLAQAHSVHLHILRIDLAPELTLELGTRLTHDRALVECELIVGLGAFLFDGGTSLLAIWLLFVEVR